MSNHTKSFGAHSVNADLSSDRLCPFCGSLNQGFDAETPCGKCLIVDSPAARNAAQARMGPWFLLHSRNPSAPGMSYAAMVGLIRRGQAKPASIVRGPTTGQLWQFASSVRGLSREFGVCYDCGKALNKETHFCPHCHKVQELSGNPDIFIETTDEIRPSEPPALATKPAPRPQPIAAVPPPANKPAPAASQPAPPEPTSRGTDTLSMRHLATAFSVQYAPPVPVPHGKRIGRTIFRAILVLVLVGLLGLAGYCWADPIFFSKVQVWTVQQYDLIHHSVMSWIGR